MEEQKKVKSGIAMVCISGSKVRSLREEQNLTQLYLATAVGVTTETISRWERQEAPTVKKENGLKLADALTVSLDAIIAPGEQAAVKEPVVPGGLWEKKYWIVAAVLLAASLLVFLSVRQGNGPVHLSAKRTMPAHSVANHPFPVVIDVDFVSKKNSSFLLKEKLPAGCRVLHTLPPTTAAGDGFLKWIDKNGSGKRSFAYLVTCNAESGKDVSFTFEGFLFVRESSNNEIPVNGRSRLRVSTFHWADDDRNKSIDDEELLAVYDDFGRVDGLEVDVEEVENIWMGSGYRWDAEQAVFEIIP
jgi:transcriptional regulator with XRE-family HTH domain